MDSVSADKFKEVAKDRLFLHTIDSDTFKHFSNYNYEAWIPPKSRRDWINQWILPGEYIDIGCGGYPVTMDISDGRRRGVGVDVSEKAALRHKKYFKDFYLFDIENIELREIPDLLKRFETVVLSETLEHFRDPLPVLNKIKRFLRPGGRILITYPNAYSVAQYVDRATHRGRWHRFADFHENHIYLVRKHKLEVLFEKAGLVVKYFDFRPSDIIEGFPDEKSKFWKRIAQLTPSFLGHQFFYVLDLKK